MTKKYEYKRKDGTTVNEEITKEWYDEADGSELTQTESKEYQIIDKIKKQTYANTTKYYGYKKIEIKTDWTYVCRRKPRQLQLFNSANT